MKWKYKNVLEYLVMCCKVEGSMSSSLVSSVINEAIIKGRAMDHGDFYIDNYINWSFKTSSVWNRKTEKSLLLMLTHLVWQKSNTMNLSPTVKDTFNISLSTQNKTHKEIYSYLRTSEISFLKNYTLSSGAGLSFGYEQYKTF